MSKKTQKRLATIIVSVVAAIWLGVGAMWLGGWVLSLVSNSGLTNPLLAPTEDGNNIVFKDEADLIEVAKKASQSVVSIVTSQVSGRGYYQQNMEGAGTGIIISKDGYVLTNKHVISGTDRVEIVMSNGTRFNDVKIIGVDPLNDLAFLKIRDGKDLPVASIGDSGTVRVGQRVIAIGNSLGQYQNTVTSGIISGLGRPVTAASNELGTKVESLSDLLQTDAAINPGNSGGPLINMSGQVIGVNTAIASNAQSIGFAIPINAAKGLIRGVIETGTVKKAFIGVQYVAITPDIWAEYKLSQKNGALITSSRGTAVVAGGPADAAGLKSDDIIIKVGNKVVGEQGGLGSLIAEYLPGEKARLTIVRDGKTIEKELTFGTYRSPEA